MKTKILFFVMLLVLTPTFSTVSYGQAALQRLVGGLLRKAVEKNKNTKTTEITTSRASDNSATNVNDNSATNVTNANDEVTLIVSGKAKDREKATAVALRSAIEQAYGTFVSANTTILNDDLVKDEIVTISNGNIKSYKVLGDVKCEDGQVMVTVDATVCISKLISYAKSKGASTEFAGATFAQNMKMKELNKKNELQALQNVLVMAKELLPLAFDKKLYVLNPTVAKAKIMDRSVNPVLKNQYNNFQNLTDGYYQIVMNVVMEPNDNTQKVLNNIYETLKAISLSKKEIAEYEKVGINTSEINIFMPGYCKSFENYWRLTFRNSKEETNKWLLDFISLFASEFSNFKIVDNLGEISTFKGALMAKDQCTHGWRDTGTVRDCERLEKYGIMNDNYWFYFTQGTGIFKDGICATLHLPEYEKSSGDSPRLVLAGLNASDDLPEGLDGKDDYAYWILKFRISASEISKYSDFKLESNSK